MTCNINQLTSTKKNNKNEFDLQHFQHFFLNTKIAIFDYLEIVAAANKVKDVFSLFQNYHIMLEDQQIQLQQQ